MIRLYIVAEGLTEFQFVVQLLKSHLEAAGKGGIDVQAPRLGGYRTWTRSKKFLRTLLQSPDPEVRVTTMIDLFKIAGDIPGRSDLPDATPLARVHQIERLIAEDVGDKRFFPYIQLHEFEALVLSDLAVLAEQRPNRRGPILDLKARLDKEFESPEHVNRVRPPSYWIKDVVPEYQKPTDGINAVVGIGIPKLRERCVHFGQWLDYLESLTT